MTVYLHTHTPTPRTKVPTLARNIICYYFIFYCIVITIVYYHYRHFYYYFVYIPIHPSIYVGDFILTRQQKHVSMIPMSSGILRSFTRMASSFKKIERQERKNSMETDKKSLQYSVQFIFILKLAIFRLIITFTSLYKTKYNLRRKDYVKSALTLTACSKVRTLRLTWFPIIPASIFGSIISMADMASNRPNLQDHEHYVH